MKKGYIFYILIFITSIITIAPAQSEANNKKASEIVHNGKIIKIIDDSIYDSARKRAIPIRVYLDQSHGPKPVILFSHGLGGSRENNGFLGKYWAAKGYVSIFMQHKGSDQDLWREKSKIMGFLAMKKAANFDNFMKRVEDVTIVLDQLEEWSKTSQNPLGQHVDINKVGMAGHSFGAVTTQFLSGQSDPLGNARLTDRRIKAALILSPSPPRRGSVERAFSTVSIPWMLMTGTKDNAPIGGMTPEKRLEVFPALPPQNKYQLVLNNANHFAFSDFDHSNQKQNRNPNHHKVIAELSTAFWDAWLKRNMDSQLWLTSNKPLSIIDSLDHWQIK